MATFSPVSPQHTITTNANFIPELWSDEVIATYEQNLVIADKVRKMSMKGKKGDTIHVPIPARAEPGETYTGPSEKAPETAVTLIVDTAGELMIEIDQHFEYSRMIEDFAEVQSLPSARRFYTEDAGYALSRHVDTDLGILASGWGNNDRTVLNTPTGWTHDQNIRAMGKTLDTHEPFVINQSSATDTFNDATFRYALQLLDDQDVPMSSRCLIICPSAVNDIRGIDRYNSVDFVNNKGVANGEIGNIYGVPVYVSTNVPVIETATQNTSGAFATRGNMLFHKDAIVLAEQVGVRSQTDYQLEHLSTLFTSDRIYGRNVYRPGNGVVIATAEPG
jgi:N4-gp56 family major capsid protein